MDFHSPGDALVRLTTITGLVDRVRPNRIHILILVVLLAVGCTPTIVDYSVRVHVVQAGDTLQMVAWRYGLDTRDLARWNQLENPDLIFVGQRLILMPTGGAQVAVAPPARRPSSTLLTPNWRWPVQGPLVSPFRSGSTESNGIGIGGEIGQDVRAAAPGQVVYAGDRLLGYGQLVLIEHNDTYLSAYGHNDQLVVTEGDVVEQGQVIANMGMGPGQKPQLHFEIRRNGAPVDPFDHLPR